MRVMAIDYGDARTGVAISDRSGLIIGSTEVIHSRRDEQIAERIVRLCADNGVERLVVGLPRNMNGSEGPRAELCRAFAALLEEKTGLPVALWDERRTTVEAHWILSESGYHGKKRKNTVDAVAASLILEGYLAFLRRTSEPPIQV